MPRRPTDEPPHRRPPRTRASTAKPSPARTRRTPPPGAVPPEAAGRGAGGLTGLFRGAGTVFGQVSGIDVPARALDRLAASAERATAFLDRLDAEIGIERAVELLDRLDHLGDVLEESHRSLREIERMIGEIHARVTPPLVRLPLGRRRGSASG